MAVGLAAERVQYLIDHAAVPVSDPGQMVAAQDNPIISNQVSEKA